MPNNNEKYLTINCKKRQTDYPLPNNTIIHFPKGIPGFDQITHYKFTSQPEVKLFMNMTATDQSNISFFCIDSFTVYPKYSIKLTTQLISDLKITPQTQLIALSIVTVGTSVEETTANLLGPIIINLNNKQGLQTILENSEYQVRYKIWDSILQHQQQNNQK